MKKITLLMIFCSFGLACNNLNLSGPDKIGSDQKIIDANEESERNKILLTFSRKLNASIPEYRRVNRKGFGVTQIGELTGFTVFDLTDTLNKQLWGPSSISLADSHFYHFSPTLMPYSQSHIAYFEHGVIRKIFKSVNCTDRGDNIKDVLTFADEKLKNCPNKKNILENISNYRKYGFYIRTDHHSQFVNCDCNPCE